MSRIKEVLRLGFELKLNRASNRSQLLHFRQYGA